ncbi:hypothetical protein JCM17843_09910 [Kordiimonadales bacterium JCM 17843]|nr:hypothetical protein JCM17843_09910 [Kordiimonadales bacterium JCM 17843]
MQIAAQGFAAKAPALALRLRHGAPVATGDTVLDRDGCPSGLAALACVSCMALSWASGRESITERAPLPPTMPAVPYLHG